MSDVTLSKWDFYSYCRLLHKISVVYSKFRNDTAYILYSVLNSRLLKPTILKFSFMFIEFRYNLSFRVSADFSSQGADDGFLSLSADSLSRNGRFHRKGEMIGGRA